MILSVAGGIFSLFALSADAVPPGWTAEGHRFGGEGAVEVYRGDHHHHLYAETIEVDGAVFSDEFILEKPWLNLKFCEDTFRGTLSLVTMDDEGRVRESRTIPDVSRQAEGWLNDGWFAFEVSELIGLRARLQVRDLASLDEFTLERVEPSNRSRGPENLDWYVAKMTALMKADEAVANSDPFRPVIHTAIPSGKSWDANGLVFKDGVYHFFYLARPNGSTPVMGHKRSTDLIHWEELPPACVPSFAHGETAVWSGSAILGPDGRCHLYYTSVGPARPTACNPYQGHGVSIDDDFVRFRKVAPNMIVNERDIPDPVQQVRDPFAFRVEDRYFITLTGGILREEYRDTVTNLEDWDHEQMAPVLMLFESGDLYEWTYRGLVFREDRTGFCEVSDLFEQEGRWFYSPGGMKYFVGDLNFDSATYTPAKQGTANTGLFYAYRSMTAPDGRRLAISRIKEGGDLATKKWTECYTLVREWWLEGDVLHQRPAEENHALRTGHRECTGTVSGVEALFEAGGEYEIVADLVATTAARCGLQLRRSDDGSRFFQVGWDVTRNEAWCSVIKDGEVVTYDAPWMARLAIRPENKQDPHKVTFRVIIDRGLAEIFIDDQKTINRWVEDIPIDCTGVAVFAEGGEVEVDRLDYWDLEL
ncbi:glycoside hydrolase family 32 protein [Kiritimatiella glycovorans]|uniref:glycoside hydrolase family 32 protein n=1 Tax=Kiritimatiella glycovorans TaxID=1307763 RepID=UPI001364C4CF|nr:glycoside hydrolase family 32 protein [Kiritimatiella glycovorans]